MMLHQLHKSQHDCIGYTQSKPLNVPQVPCYIKNLSWGSRGTKYVVKGPGTVDAIIQKKVLVWVP